MYTIGLEGEQSSISAHGGKQERGDKLSTSGNYKCSVQVFMMVLRERINGWVEESGMLGDIQECFRMGRRTEDNIFYVREDD